MIFQYAYFLSLVVILFELLFSSQSGGSYIRAAAPPNFFLWELQHRLGQAQAHGITGLVFIPARLLHLIELVRVRAL